MTDWCHSTRPPHMIRSCASSLLFLSDLCSRLKISIWQASNNLIWITRILEHVSWRFKSACEISGELVCQLRRPPYSQFPRMPHYKDEFFQGQKQGGGYSDEASDPSSNLHSSSLTEIHEYLRKTDVPLVFAETSVKLQPLLKTNNS